MKSTSLFAFISVLALVVTTAARADDPEIKTYPDPDNPCRWSYYERADGTCVICGISPLPRGMGLLVPDLNGMVREIAPHAFENQTNIWSVSFPNCITNIGEYAFSGCRTLQFRSLPTNLTGIGKGAFKNCFLTNAGLNIPPGVETIEDYAFAGNQIWGELLVLPEGLKHIGDWALDFEGHTESLSFPNSVTNIGSGVFKGLADLKSLHLPTSLVNLGGEETFRGCSSLREIVIPYGTKRIGRQMFGMCRSLTNVVISATVETIGPSAFYYCTNLTAITIPASVTNIAAEAFEYCPFEELEIPLGMVSMAPGSLHWISWLDNDGRIHDSLRLLRLPRQFEGKLGELALFGYQPSSTRPQPVPSGCEVVFYGPYNLSVSSAWGTPSPAGFVNHLVTGTPVECSVYPSEITTADTRRRCTGWTGTGDVPVSGTGTNVSFTATERNSTLKWNWESEYRIICEVSGAATEFSSTNWLSEGETFYAPFSPTAPSFRVTVSGDTDGVVVDETEGRISIPADRARQVSVEVVPFLETTTTPVPVPCEWLDGFPALLAACGGSYESFANSTNAANGRAVWECYVLGLTPDGARDLRITSFPMKADGTPDLDRLTFDPPQSEWRLTNAVPVIQGRSSLSAGDSWRDVPSGGDNTLFFFRVRVALP